MANPYMLAGVGVAVVAVGASLAVVALSTSKVTDATPAAPAKSSSTVAPSATAARPVEVVRLYVAQTGCMDRARFVLNPRENRAAMLDRYGSQLCAGAPPTLDDAQCAGLLPGASCGVVARWVDGEVANICVTATPGGPLIDWRCSVGYGPIPLKTYKATMPKGPTLFRVYGAISDYYNYAFRDARATHYSIAVTEGDGTGEQVSAYLPKSAATAPAAFALLKDGRSHAMMVELDYGASRESSIVGMTRFVAPSWLQQPEEIRPPGKAAP